ncbi:restriction endonuclease [Rhodococcus triatomae]|nr:NaeI family type II restriction endonuclease [Rhodococcus triatomae]QNG18186.1 restriction endonuclease [Rhodococcus triatomae]QNG22144.1 restriction endonuclease [Rhodococcus triatomae]
MSTVRYRPKQAPPSPPNDLEHVASFFESAPDGRERFRWTLRDSLDEALDGQRTGRWCYQHLRKTEKTYLGTAVEINLTREFDISDGHDLDWRILDTEVDCKFSRDLGGWEIPTEMYVCAHHGEQSADYDQIALLTWLNDDTKEWAAGLLRISDSRLRWRRDKSGADVRAYNKDFKRRISESSLADIYWLWGGIQTDLPTNLLRHLPKSTRDEILKPGSSGQGRVDALFRHVQNRLINRNVVLTVGQQDDAPKRARDARIHLRPHGIIVLGHDRPHQRIADSLGLEIPSKGSWISTRVAPVPPDDVRSSFFLDEQWWARATGDDESEAPTFPTKKWDGLRFAPPAATGTSRTDITWAP